MDLAAGRLIDSRRLMNGSIIDGVDVVVVGAGPAGGSAALSLARRGVRVLLVEKVGGHAVCVGDSLLPAARPLLQSLGVWERFTTDGHLPSYGNRSSWGTDDLAESSAIFNPYGHGWHLDRPAFNAMLVAAAEQAGTSRIAISRVLGWEPDGSGRGTLRLEQDDKTLAIPASVVLDCSGRSASVARGLGVERVYDDKLIAAAAVLEPHRSGDSDTTTTIEAVDGGWWYTALVPGSQRVFVYLSDGDLMDGRATSGPLDWLQRLNQTRHIRRFVERFDYQLIGQPAVVSACSSRLAQVVGETWIAAGDAAVSFDPLSSQGLLTAMATGRHAAAVVLEMIGGRREVAQSYAASLHNLYQDYLARKTWYYALERRWPESPFWKRRLDRPQPNRFDSAPASPQERLSVKT
jgi:flavin-dependent dehydrogenase